MHRMYLSASQCFFVAPARLPELELRASPPGEAAQRKNFGVAGGRPRIRARSPPGPRRQISIFAVMQATGIAVSIRSRRNSRMGSPPGRIRNGLLVDKEGRAGTRATGNGTIGELDPATARCASTGRRRAGPAHSGDRRFGVIWFTSQSGLRRAPRQS